MRRILSIFMAFAIVCSVMVLPTVSASAESTAYDEAYGLMRALEVIPNAELVETEVTRARFAVYTARVLGVNSFKQNGVRYYSDVPMDSSAATAINYLAEIGVLSVGSDKKFRPDDAIRLEEAVKMLVSAMGYRVFAEMNGGFPTGYLAAARRLQMIDAEVSGGPLSTDDAVRLLYEAVKAPVADVTGVVQDELVRENTGATLLSNYHDIYYDRGLVTGVDGSYLYSDAACEADEIVINGKNYDCEGDLYGDRLGGYVRYYYRKTPEKQEKIVYIESETNDSVEINISDIAKNGYSKNGIVYYRNNAEKSVSLSNAVVVYNGRPLEDKVSQTMNNLNYGTVTIKQMSGKNDLVLVTDYEDIYSEKRGVDDEIFQNYIDGTKSLSLEDVEICKIADFNGNPLEFETVALPAVLSVAKSVDGKYVKVVVSNKTVSGDISSLRNRTDGMIEITIGGAEYFVDDDYYEENKAKFQVGAAFECSLNFEDVIVYASGMKSTSIKFGYMIDAGVVEGTFNDTFKVKLFDWESQKILVFDGADRVVIDGSSYKKADEMLGAVPTDAAGGRAQMVTYKLSDGKIAYLDTATNIVPGQADSDLREGESEDTALYAYYHRKKISDGSFSGTTTDWYDAATYDAGFYATGGRIGLKYLIADGMRILSVPADNNKEAKYWFRSVSIANDTILNDQSLGFHSIYKIGKDSVAFTHGLGNSGGSQLASAGVTYMVKEVCWTLDDEQNEVVQMELLSVNGTEIWNADTNVLPEANDIEIGDLIDISGTGGDLTALRKVYDVSESEKIDGYPAQEENDGLWSLSRKKVESDKYGVWLIFNDNGQVQTVNYAGGGFQLTFGFVTDTSGDKLRFKWEKPKSVGDADSHDEVYGTYLTGSSAKVFVYDSESETVKKGTVADMKDYKTYGDDCSRVILKTRWGRECNGIYVFN